MAHTAVRYAISNGSRRLEVDLDPLTTIAALRVLATAHFGVDPVTAKLLYGGKCVDDACGDA